MLCSLASCVSVNVAVLRFYFLFEYKNVQHLGQRLYADTKIVSSSIEMDIQSIAYVVKIIKSDTVTVIGVFSWQLWNVTASYIVLEARVS